jgi:hypothetical protein
LEARENGRMKGTDWYGYVYPKNLEVMLSKKILVPDIANRASFAWDENGEYTLTSGYAITLKSEIKESYKYILGLLNSRVLDFYLKKISTPLRGGFFRYFTQFIEQLPIRTIDFDDPADVDRHDRVVGMVEHMITLKNKHTEAEIMLENRRHDLAREIERLDTQIDQLVYELYGLTEQEIALVEAN